VSDASHEQDTILERKELTADQVHAALRMEGEEELERSSSGLFWSALCCGITLGLSLIAQGELHHVLPDTVWRPAVAALGYAVGFIALILARQELYTSNTLTAVLPILDSRRVDMLPNLIRVSVVVLAGNLAGAAAFAAAAAWTPAFSEPLRTAFADIGVQHTTHTMGATFVKGIFGGWMIALMTWLMPGAHHARIWVIGIVAWCLAASEMTHVIAGSVDVLFAVMVGRVEIGTYAVGFFLPTLVGNTLGGMVLVAALNHAQVAAGDPQRSSQPVVDPAEWNLRPKTGG
jgi:formate/nitrite transporter FocA (FNT family)